jgi:sulfotransferase
MNSFDQFVCLSGLPRSGSTLLSAILSQNPALHCEGNSPVCHLMWEMCNILSTHSEQIRANNKEKATCDIVSQIPHIYYQNIPERIILDKCRSWTIPTNITMLETSLKIDVKIIVMTRPILEIMGSFAYLYKNNHCSDDELNRRLRELLLPNSEPLMRSIKGINCAKKNYNNAKFLFISYDDIITKTEDTINKIYTFCEWIPFQHSFDNIMQKYAEDDSVYGLIGFHDIRPSIGRRNYDILLPKEIMKKCSMIDEIL